MTELDVESDRGIEATMLLCDAAEASNGKLYILGGGWTQLTLGSPPTPWNMALAIQLLIPWDQANQPMDVEVALIDDEGQPVDLGGGPIRANGKLEVGRPPGIKPGTSLDSTMTMSFNGLIVRRAFTFGSCG